MKIGYERISDKGQNVARQDELMKKLGVEKTFTDVMSGRSKERPSLDEMMALFVKATRLLLRASVDLREIPRIYWSW